jgi:hypothetical protein
MAASSASFAIAVVLLFAFIGGVWAEVTSVGNLLHGVITDKERYAQGAPVKITYAIRNQGAAPLTYNFSSGKLFDVWVRRGDAELWRYSKGQVYTQAVTSITLQPNETRRFEVIWNQVGDDGKAIGPGTYEVNAQLTPSSGAPPPVTCSIQIGSVSPAAVPLPSIREGIRNSTAFQGKTVYFTATYRGWRPDPGDPNTRPGPPITRSDWAVCDSTGCMYVTGGGSLDPDRDFGSQVKVTGKFQKTPNGQVYLLFVSVQKTNGS